MIQRRQKQSRGIPLPAMADIAFLLLVFFMLSSIADSRKQVPINLPETRGGDTIERHIYSIS
ncbi:MAG: biopolymer transporter ExbD, partial [Clostridia bacterium]|nr:biopolymer transporter ExbD [Clostridia bacterium]